MVIRYINKICDICNESYAPFRRSLTNRQDFQYILYRYIILCVTRSWCIYIVENNKILLTVNLNNILPFNFKINDRDVFNYTLVFVLL